MFKYWILAVCLLMIGCISKNQANKNNLSEQVISSIFKELIQDEEVYLSFEGFKAELDLSNANEGVPLDTLQKLYASYLEDIKKQKIVLRKVSSPLTKEDKKMIVDLGFESILVNQEKEKYNYKFDNLNIPDYIEIEYSNKEIFSHKENLSFINFSEVFFNQEENKGVFFYEKLCGELCYSKELIVVERNRFNKWHIKSREEIIIG